VLEVLQLGLDQRSLCGVLQDVVVEVPLVVDLEDKVVNAGLRLDAAALERLRSDHLAVVDEELLIEGRWLVSGALQRGEVPGHTVFLHLHGQRGVRFLDEVEQGSDGLRARRGHQLLA